ncbi:MAG: hypothetical protein M1546_02165, partial [Chloroflexi bacterium]|nr:hypothetical protein [Chloroflexota bacterium]
SMQPHNSETLVYAIEGLVRDAQHMRFSLRDRHASNGLQGSLNQSPSTDLLVADGVAYERHGDRWERQNAGQNNAQAAPGLNSDALLLLEVAKQVRQLSPAEGLGGHYERVAFSLHSDDVLRFLLAQRGQLTPQNLQLLRASGASYSGDGELWIDAHGYPARLALDMRFERSGGDAYRALVASTAEYGQFGQPLAPELFDPAVAPLSLQSRSVLPGVSITSDQLIQVSLQWGALLAALTLLVVLISYTRHRWRGPRLTRALNLVLIVTMITPGVARAGYPEQPSQQTPAQESEVARMMREARSVAQKNRIGPYAPQADALPDQADQDNDGLPNGYEIQLGTNPFARDTDLDGLDDKTEVVGKPCPTYDGDTSPANVVTDPINPDSNYDSIRDGDELQTGKCWAGKQPYAWSDDNDSDGVPDVLDLSPFSASGDLGAKFVQEWPSAGYYQPMPGANLSFDPVVDTANTGAQPVEPFYVEVQVVPQDRDTLRYAYKDALYWPKGDDLGNIRNLIGMTTTGKLTVVPFLEVTVFEDDLPSAAARNAYGIGASKVISECTVNCDFHLVIPLAPVERSGLTHALQGKVLYEARSAQRLSWQDMRLKWALRGNIGRPGPDNTTEPGDFGFAIYDEGYRITGMQVQRQGGAQTLVAAAKPTGPQQKLTDGPVALLRAGLEARFLTGGIGIPDIQQRFDIATANSTPITDRWGITFTYYITSQTNFVHLDQALLTTNITLTRAMLNKAYPSHNISPTLVIATQQRTATINLDEIDAPNYADLSFNLCGKDMVTSRSLRLATYDWDPLADSGLAISDFGLGIFDFGLNQDATESNNPNAVADSGLNQDTAGSDNPKSQIQNLQSLGDWYLMGLEEVLKKVQSEYDQIFSKSDPFYEAGLTVLKLVTTNWNQGITAIQNMGSITWQDITNAITDLGLYQRITQWLFEQGFLPAEFALVVNFVLGVWEAGGPVAWLEQQWNMFVSFIDGFGKLVSGSVVNFTLTPATTGDGTVNLSLADLMSFTRTAINVLNYFANILGLGVLADIANILTKVLEILEKVRQVWNTIQAGIQAIQKGIDAALTVIANELKAVAKPMGVFGLIVFVGFTLFNLFMTLANASGITQLIFAVLVLKAVWEIVKAVVLFVIASYFPIGTIVAAGVALINWLVDMVGGVAGEVLQWIFDPIGALLDAILANPPPEQLTNVFGNPRISGLDFVRYPDAPLGGIMEGQRFGFALTGTLSMSGPSRGLSHSGAKMYLGRYAGGKDFELCGMSILQFLKDTGNEDEAAEYGIDIALNRCRTFSFSSEYLWSYSNNTRKYIKSSQYLTDTIYLENGASFELPFDIRLRDFTTASELTVTPHRPAINGKVALDVSYKIRAWFENCGILGLDCDEYSDAFFTPPAGSYVYFDILPTRLRDLWNWEDLFNDDADGDGIKGYKNEQGNPVGQDATLCGVYNAATPDADGDNLGDNYELQNDTDPCNPDGDGDGIKDGRELELGTDPNLADTDGDGLHDGQEVPYWYDYDDTLTTNMLWTVNMGGAYTDLPDPLAFPNPRQANFDNDHRSDSREKVKLTGPNAYNPVPVGEPLELAAAQRLLNGGGTEVNVTSFEWPNDEASALSATLTISLPVPFTGLSASINMITKTGVPQLDLPQAIAGLPANTYGWRLPPLWLGRKVSVTLSGLPQIVSTPVSVTVNMVYSEATTTQHSTSQVLLLVNRGGPDVRILSPISGTIWTGVPQTLNGSARDPEGVARVDVCLNTVQAPCAAAGWQLAIGKRQWQYNWTPPGSGRYYLYARGADSYNVTGPVFGPVVVTVDAVPPSAASFDDKNTRYLSTTLSSDASPLITLTGRVSDTAGAFASGAGQAFIRIVSADTNKLHNTAVIQPGALSSAYVFSWTFPLGSLGKAAPAA